MTPIRRIADDGVLAPALLKAASSAFVTASEGQQLPLRIWQSASCGHAAKPVRYLPIMRSGVPIPTIAIGGDILQCTRVFL